MFMFTWANPTRNRLNMNKKQFQRAQIGCARVKIAERNMDIASTRLPPNLIDNHPPIIFFFQINLLAYRYTVKPHV